MLPFSTEDFFAVFTAYNESVWPMQWFLHAVGAVVLVLSGSRLAWRDRIVCGLLAGLWAWMAVAYHLAHFARINPAAALFAAGFLVEAGVLIWWAIAGRALQLCYRLDLPTLLGVGMVAYALLVYPWLNGLLGHTYPFAPTFGVPCPTTVFTLGVLLLARDRKAAVLSVIPVLWSVIGGSAAFLLGVWQDLGLLASASIVIVWLARRFRLPKSELSP